MTWKPSVSRTSRPMLIDSTFYIDALRRRQDVRFLLRAWLIAGQLWTCGVIRAEVVRGVRSPQIKADLGDLFDLMAEVPTDAGLWRATAELAWKLDRRGSVLPLTDLIIAACALQAQKVSAKQTVQGQLESRQQLGAKYPVTFEHLRRPIGVLLQEVDEDLSARGVYDPKFHGTVSGITEALFVEVIASGRR